MVSPPPCRMQTRGRESIRAPKKYDGLVAHDNSEEEIYQPTLAQRRSLAYRGKVIEFNPNLPPAAFPTLELGQRRDNSTPILNQNAMRDPPVEQNNRNLPCEMHRSAYSTLNTSTFNTTALHSSEFNRYAVQTPSLDTDLLRNHPDVSDGMETPVSPRSAPITPLSAYPMAMKRSSQGEERWNTNSELQNPVYANNMEILKRLDARTEEDWNIAEMETSDDGEPSGRPVLSNRARSYLSPTALSQLWEGLPVALKMDLVDVMKDLFPSGTEAMQCLHHNGPQRQKMLDLLDKRDEQIAAEDEAAASLRSETKRILLSRSGEELKRVTQSGFRQLLQGGLYTSIGEVDYYTITRKELSKAKEYLRCCGQKPELLDHWTSALGARATYATSDSAENINQPDSLLPHGPNNNQARPQILHSTMPTPPKEVSAVASRVSMQPSLNIAMLNNSQCADSPSRTSQRSFIPQQLPRPFLPPDPSLSRLPQDNVSELPKASDYQTPRPTPEILAAIPAPGHPTNPQALDKGLTNGGGEDDEGPPSKKRQVSTNKRKSVAFATTSTSPTNTKPNNPMSAPKATTKTTRRKATTPASTIAPVAPVILHQPAASLTPLPSSAAPKSTAATTLKKYSMSPPPNPTLSNTSNHTTPPAQPPMITNQPAPTTALAPAPSNQPKDPRRRKSTAPIPPSIIADRPPPKPEASKPAARPKTAPTPKKPAPTNKKTTAAPTISKVAGKEQGKFAARNAANGGGVGAEMKRK